MIVKECTVSHQREIKRGKMQAVATIMFCLLISFLVLTLGMAIHDHFKKIVLLEDLNFSTLNAFPPLFSATKSQHTYVQNCSDNVQTMEDWISPRDVWHLISDEELMWMASRASLVAGRPFDRTPKIAFMFLTRGRLPLAPLWEIFFKGHEDLFSIYLHASPEFNDEPPESSVFHRRRIRSKVVEWGKSSMIDAERRLLANALLDFTNEHFVLLSETCIPLFNFSTIYTHLTSSNTSFLDAFDDPRPSGRGRYNHQMGPTISLSDWRKGSQWFEVNREVALAMISDTTYYPIFRNFCLPPCYMDEHYFPTLVTKLRPDAIANRTLTWTDWSKGGPHPKMFGKKEVNKGLVEGIRKMGNCGIGNVCFLFARKFHPSSLQPLLRLAPMLFGLRH